MYSKSNCTWSNFSKTCSIAIAMRCFTVILFKYLSQRFFTRGSDNNINWGGGENINAYKHRKITCFNGNEALQGHHSLKTEKRGVYHGRKKSYALSGHRGAGGSSGGCGVSSKCSAFVRRGGGGGGDENVTWYFKYRLLKW